MPRLWADVCSPTTRPLTVRISGRAYLLACLRLCRQYVSACSLWNTVNSLMGSNFSPTLNLMAGATGAGFGACWRFSALEAG
jgi:hypothetical protein